MWNICRKTLRANFLDNNEINRRYTERMHTHIHTSIQTLVHMYIEYRMIKCFKFTLAMRVPIPND